MYYSPHLALSFRLPNPPNFESFDLASNTVCREKLISPYGSRRTFWDRRTYTLFVVSKNDGAYGGASQHQISMGESE